MNTAANNVADKVAAEGDTPEACLNVVNTRIDEVAIHGVRFGTSMGPAVLEGQSSIDLSVHPVGFPHGDPEEGFEL